MYSFSWEVPVTSLKWKIQVAARRPTPQTQNRGRRRVCLGLLGTFIPPAAAAAARWLSGQNMSPPRSLLLTPVPRFQAGSQWPVALPPPPTPDLSSWRYFIFGLHSLYRGVFDRFGLSSAPQHPAPVSQCQHAAPTSASSNSSKHAKTMNHQPVPL